MRLSRALLAAFFVTAGTLHFTKPRFYEAMVPPSLLPRKREVVAVSGVAEIAGAAMVLHPASRRLGRWWLLALLVAVFPANVHMAVNPEQVPGLDLKKLPRWALWARLPLQPLAMLWVWQATRGR
ncbi:MAG TPA: MauE/DoxX family redox-associated membrane protein [Solirubrobacterales bacterium]|nr:MauE/DoxX family redox-associated membrane protein [Solirubrobacterales bacterium]